MQFSAFETRAVIDDLASKAQSRIDLWAGFVGSCRDPWRHLNDWNKGFAQNTPDQMRELILSRGYRIEEEDTGTMWHSSIVRFTTG